MGGLSRSPGPLWHRRHHRSGLSLRQGHEVGFGIVLPLLGIVEEAEGLIFVGAWVFHEEMANNKARTQYFIASAIVENAGGGALDARTTAALTGDRPQRIGNSGEKAAEEAHGWGGCGLPRQMDLTDLGFGRKHIGFP